jgi:hypothetical protein
VENSGSVIVTTWLFQASRIPPRVPRAGKYTYSSNAGPSVSSTTDEQINSIFVSWKHTIVAPEESISVRIARRRTRAFNPCTFQQIILRPCSISKEVDRRGSATTINPSGAARRQHSDRGRVDVLWQLTVNQRGDGTEDRERDRHGEEAIVSFELSGGDLLVGSDDPQGAEELNLGASFRSGRRRILSASRCRRPAPARRKVQRRPP